MCSHIEVGYKCLMNKHFERIEDYFEGNLGY